VYGDVFEELTIDTVGVFDDVARGRKNPLWQGLANRLKRLRDHAGLTQGEVGNAAGCDGSVIHFIEAGRRPGVDTLAHVAAALNVPAYWLTFGADGDEPLREKIPRPKPPPAERLDAQDVVAIEGLAERLAAHARRGVSSPIYTNASGLHGAAAARPVDPARLRRLRCEMPQMLCLHAAIDTRYG